jgi:hypothetical protein
MTPNYGIHLLGACYKIANGHLAFHKNQRCKQGNKNPFFVCCSFCWRVIVNQAGLLAIFRKFLALQKTGENRWDSEMVLW